MGEGDLLALQTFARLMQNFILLTTYAIISFLLGPPLVDLTEMHESVSLCLLTGIWPIYSEIGWVRLTNNLVLQESCVVHRRGGRATFRDPLFLRLWLVCILSMLVRGITDRVGVVGMSL